jgi:hypothetical protein
LELQGERSSTTYERRREPRRDAREEQVYEEPDVDLDDPDAVTDGPPLREAYPGPRTASTGEHIEPGDVVPETPQGGRPTEGD